MAAHRTAMLDQVWRKSNHEATEHDDPEEHANWLAAMAGSPRRRYRRRGAGLAVMRAERKAANKLDIRSELLWAEYLRWQNERDARTHEIGDLMTAGTPHDQLPMQLNYVGWLWREREMAKGMTHDEADIATSLKMIATEPERAAAARKAERKLARKRRQAP